MVLTRLLFSFQIPKRMASGAVKLSYNQFGSEDTVSPLVVVHGLFGNKNNFTDIAQRLATELRCKVYTVDLRSHGLSPRTESLENKYTIGDLELFMSDIVRSNSRHAGVSLYGHSMGGKLVTLLALRQPLIIDRLILEDVAPKSYLESEIRFGPALKSIADLDLSKFKTVEEAQNTADPLLATNFEHKSTRDFILSNLDSDENGLIVWRADMRVISKDLTDILTFPENMTRLQYPGPTLVVLGALSPYVRPPDYSIFQQYFPSVQIESVPNAGHWVHQEKPQQLVKLVYKFYSQVPKSKV